MMPLKATISYNFGRLDQLFATRYTRQVLELSIEVQTIDRGPEDGGGASEPTLRP